MPFFTGVFVENRLHMIFDTIELKIRAMFSVNLLSDLPGD
jgi:hypothetical protein